VPREDSDLLVVVRQVVDAMPDEARLVFALRHHEGLSCVQIASLLDRPEGTIYSRLSRIHAAIRRAAEVRE
jgi:DNA-directed RNA polymerase specialized sigma24 family protein